METEEEPRLFDQPEGWEELWRGMPEYVQNDKDPECSLKVHFRTEDDKKSFLELVGPNRVHKQSIWYPAKGEQDFFSHHDAPKVRVSRGQYPIYVISKGRASTPFTIKALEQLSLPHFVVVEPQEYDEYAAAVGPSSQVVRLPFRDLGQGSIPARNWVMEDSIRRGANRHWILDDNLRGFYRLNRNVKEHIIDYNPLRAMEVFADRYRNIALAGPHYQWFVQSRTKGAPLTLNTRVYSCILVNNLLTLRWRGRYNEDTDLSLRALKGGWVNVLFRAYLIDKQATMTMKGGNTDELYAGEEDKVGGGRWKMAKSLVDQHPDCVRISEKWGRFQHHVDYKPFAHNKLVPNE